MKRSIKEPLSKKRRFAEASDTLIEAVLHDSLPNGTRQATRFWLGVLKSFLVENEIRIDMRSCCPTNLSNVLLLFLHHRFYLGLRKKKGKGYI